MADLVDVLQIEKMIDHWIGTPPNGYLGSSYGADLPSLLQKPISVLNIEADKFLAKMKQDIPILQALPAGSVNIYGQKVPGTFDKYEIFVTIFERQISLGLTGSSASVRTPD